MPDFERIQRAYESGIRTLHNRLSEALEPESQEQRQLELLTSLLQAILSAYSAHPIVKAENLDASTSVMYAAEGATAEGTGILNVPMRSLVDYGSLTPWQARFVNGALGMKRSMLVTGQADSGRSTLLNSMIHLISVDHRIVAIEEGDPLPALRDRSFTVHMPARSGTPALAQALEKAAAMKPTWLLIGELGRGDGPTFLRTLSKGTAGLTTVASPDPEIVLADWTATNAEAALHLRKIAPIVIHMERDAGGRPRIGGIYEATVDEATMRPVLTEKRPG